MVRLLHEYFVAQSGSDDYFELQAKDGPLMLVGTTIGKLSTPERGVRMGMISGKLSPNEKGIICACAVHLAVATMINVEYARPHSGGWHIQVSGYGPWKPNSDRLYQTRIHPDGCVSLYTQIKDVWYCTGAPINGMRFVSSADLLCRYLYGTVSETAVLEAAQVFEVEQSEIERLRTEIDGLKIQLGECHGAL